MQVDINSNQEKWLRAAALQSGNDVNRIVQIIINDYMKKFPLDIEEEAENPEAIEVYNFFHTIYKRRFKVDSGEEYDAELIGKTVETINEAVEDTVETINILKKAIVWYLYQHDSVGQNGERYPYKLKILFGQTWLLRSCIEQSSGSDWEMVIKASESNLSDKEMAKAIRRGDLMGVRQNEDVATLLEEALIEAESLIEEFELGKEVKKHPKMKELFISTIPSAEYIRKAMSFMQEMRQQLSND